MCWFMMTFTGIRLIRRLLATFVRKDSRKRPVLEFCDELGRNTASYEHTIERERLQGKVPCFCVINRREEIQCLLGNLGLSLQASLGYFGGWITDLNLFRKPRLFVLLGIASELIDRLEAGTGQDSFIAHVKILGPQITEQVDFLVAIRGKIRMASLRWHGAVRLAVPKQDIFTQSGAGSDQG